MTMLGIAKVTLVRKKGRLSLLLSPYIELSPLYNKNLEIFS